MSRRSMSAQTSTAVVFTGGLLQTHRAKTAHGLIRHGRRYDILAVVDQITAPDAAKMLNIKYPHRIPIVRSVKDAPRADFFVIGVAYPGGRLMEGFKEEIKAAIKRGMHIVNGLHDFLGDDPELKELAARHNISIWDVRRPPEDLTVAKLDFGPSCPVVLTVANDANIGKRTTALCLGRHAEKMGLDVGYLATGQTGIMIGCDEGVVADRLPGDFISGEIEKRVKWISDKGKDLILVEGNGCLGHHAYGPVALGILVGSHATHIIMCTDPEHKERNSFPGIPVPPLEKELELIRGYSNAELIGISLRTAGIKDWKAPLKEYRKRFGVAVLDPVRQSSAPFLKALGLWSKGEIGEVQGGLRRKSK